jgi:mono/diheme cytochrome c family protein
MNRGFKLILLPGLMTLAVLSLASASIAFAAGPPTATGDATRGAYIFSAAAGCDCHTTPAGLLAGGMKFTGPFGTVYSRNITQDNGTGIGGWTDQQIMGAIRTGKDDQGMQLFPIMPYGAYSGMSDQDVADLVAYLRTIPPIKNDVPENQLNFPVPPFTPHAAPPATAPTSGTARGAYLVSNVDDCGGCHTPSKADGSPDLSKMLAGNFTPDLGIVPNITPDNDTGIGKWTTDQIVTLLHTGKKPDGTQVTGAMAGVIQSGFKNLSDADAQAIATYLKSIPAVKNTPQAPQVAPTTGGIFESWGTGAGLLVLLGGALVILGLGMRGRLFRRS